MSERLEVYLKTFLMIEIEGGQFLDFMEDTVMRGT